MQKRSDLTLSKQITMLKAQWGEILGVFKSCTNALNCLDKKIAILEQKNDLIVP